MNSLGLYLKTSREKSGFSQKEVYNKTGITDSRLCRIENDSTICPPNELRKLSELYQISIIDTFLMAGYITENDLRDYQMAFEGVLDLTDEEKTHIQQCIHLFIKGRHQK